MENQTDPLRFLILEPESSTRAELRRLIVDTGLGEVVTVATLKDALEALDTQVIDVVVCSWELWGHGTGLSLLKLIRGEEKMRHIGFVMISQPSSDEPEKVRAARAAQTDGYLLKPLNFDILRNLLIEVSSNIPDPS